MRLADWEKKIGILPIYGTISVYNFGFILVSILIVNPIGLGVIWFFALWLVSVAAASGYLSQLRSFWFGKVSCCNLQKRRLSPAPFPQRMSVGAATLELAIPKVSIVPSKHSPYVPPILALRLNKLSNFLIGLPTLANPCTPVRFRYSPPNKINHLTDIQAPPW